MESEKKMIASSAESFRSFITKYKVNPITKKKIMVAKDASYPYEKFDDAYVLLLPLALKEMYMYVQPYVDQKTSVTEYSIKIGKIGDLARLHGQTYTFNANRQDDVRLNKGVRYVQFLADFFDPVKNKVLYKENKNSRNQVAEPKKKYDTDKKEYEDKSGYVAIQHLCAQNEGNLINYVQILCVRAWKGQQCPATLSALLEGEWKYVSRYLNFIVRFYQLTDAGMSGGLEKKRVEMMRRDVLQAIDEFEKKDKKKAVSNKIVDSEIRDDSSSMEETPSTSTTTKKRKMMNKKDDGARPAKIASKKDAHVIDEDHESDKKNVPPNVSSYIEQDVEQEIFDSVKSAVSETRKENDEQMKNDNNSICRILWN